jgi:hypothetical protein
MFDMRRHPTTRTTPSRFPLSDFRSRFQRIERKLQKEERFYKTETYQRRSLNLVSNYFIYPMQSLLAQ